MIGAFSDWKFICSYVDIAGGLLPYHICSADVRTLTQLRELLAHSCSQVSAGRLGVTAGGTDQIADLGLI